MLGMPKPMRALILALVLVSVPWISRAQTTIEATLSAPDASAYPEIHTTLKLSSSDLSENRYVVVVKNPADDVVP